MRGTDATLMTIGGADIARATDEGHAADLVLAHLFETLCAIGRDSIEFYFLSVPQRLEEFQINGALLALSEAREEGSLKYMGLAATGDALVARGVWQFHDAFDVLLVDRNHKDSSSYSSLAPIARDRNVGVITSRPLNWGFGLPFTALPSQWRLRNLTQSFYGLTIAQAAVADLAKDHPVLVGVRTPQEVQLAVSAPRAELPEGVSEMLKPFAEAFEGDADWNELLLNDRPDFRAAAERRARVTARV